MYRVKTKTVFEDYVYFKYLKNGQFHRERGPAVEWQNENKEILGHEWWVDGKRHRIDGPAVEYSNGGKEWWENDKYMGKC